MFEEGEDLAQNPAFNLRKRFMEEATTAAVDPKLHPVVWVTQVPSKRDRATGQMTPSINIGPAGEHGRLEVMMPAGAAFYDTVQLMDALRASLRNYNFKRGDSLLCLGDPAIIAVAGAVLGEWTRRFRILKWDRHIERYNTVE